MGARWRVLPDDEVVLAAGDVHGGEENGDDELYQWVAVRREGLRRESQDMDTYHGLNPFWHSPAARSSPSAFGDVTETVIDHCKEDSWRLGIERGLSQVPGGERSRFGD